MIYGCKMYFIGCITIIITIIFMVVRKCKLVGLYSLAELFFPFRFLINFLEKFQALYSFRLYVIISFSFIIQWSTYVDICEIL